MRRNALVPVYGGTSTEISPEQELANAIIRLAAKDYMKALAKLKRDPNNSNAARTAHECERFFLSDWFSILTELDGTLLMSRIQKEQHYERT